MINTTNTAPPCTICSAYFKILSCNVVAQLCALIDLIFSGRRLTIAGQFKNCGCHASPMRTRKVNVTWKTRAAAKFANLRRSFRSNHSVSLARCCSAFTTCATQVLTEKWHAERLACDADNVVTLRRCTPFVVCFPCAGETKMATLGRKLVDQLKSKEFRSYLMRYRFLKHQRPFTVTPDLSARTSGARWRTGAYLWLRSLTSARTRST